MIMTLEEFRDRTSHLDGSTEMDVQSSLEDGSDNRFPVSDVELYYEEGGTVTAILLYNEEVVTATGDADGDMNGI